MSLCYNCISLHDSWWWPLSLRLYSVNSLSWCTLDKKKIDTLTLKVLNFWKFTSYFSLKPLWLGMGEVVPARTSLTLHSPSPPTVHQLSWHTYTTAVSSSLFQHHTIVFPQTAKANGPYPSLLLLFLLSMLLMAWYKHTWWLQSLYCFNNNCFLQPWHNCSTVMPLYFLKQLRITGHFLIAVFS